MVSPSVMRELLEQATGSQPVRSISRDTKVTFSLRGESWDEVITVDESGPNVAPTQVNFLTDFALSAPDIVWADLLSQHPTPGHHSLVYLVQKGIIKLEGDQLSYEQNVQVVRAILEACRAMQHPTEVISPGKPLTATGSYCRITTSLGTSDIYVERSGSGPQILTFATAGSTTTQWHGMFTHTDITDHYEVLTADLPWHGRSQPPWDAPIGSYTLTPDSYTEYMVAVADTLELARPILLGVSMGGAAVVHAVASYPNRFAGAVACQAGPSVTGRTNEHLRGTRVNPSLFVPEWTYGLMNPASPQVFKDRVWWGYSSGGHGLYASDIDSYLQWDLANVEHLLTPTTPHIAVLSGVFDTSVPSEQSRLLAERIPNSSFERMESLGHFPHAEHPAVFWQHLSPALDRVIHYSQTSNL